jgi:hypothetical protein
MMYICGGVFECLVVLLGHILEKMLVTELRTHYNLTHLRAQSTNVLYVRLR